MEEFMNSDSDTEEPSPEALVRYLAMRRHTVGVGDSRLEAPCDLRIKLAHHQAATAALMRPMLISPSNLLQQSNLPQVLTPPSGDGRDECRRRQRIRSDVLVIVGVVDLWSGQSSTAASAAVQRR